MKTYCPEHDTDVMGCGEDCPSRRPIPRENDCPDCARLNAINERLRKLGYLIPANAGGEAIKQLKADAEWMSSQLRGFQQWAARVVALQDHVDALTAALRAEAPLQTVSQQAERLREEYESLFNQPEPPREVA